MMIPATKSDVLGTLVTKDHTLDGNGAQTDNVFQITGSVKILEIRGVCTEATDATTVTGASFTAYDGTNTVDVTESTTGTDLSGIGVGGFFYKSATAGTAVTFQDNDQVRVNDSVNSIVETHITQKTGTNTYLRFNFTGDADTDVDVKFQVRYIPLTEGSKIEAV